jgi:hypothetical protein
MALLWEALEKSANADLAAIAAKSLKEVRYHLRHSRDWLVRLGDGTDESHARSAGLADHLFPYTQEFWAHSPAEAAAVEAGIGVDLNTLRRLGCHRRCRTGRSHAAAPGGWRLRIGRQEGRPFRASRLFARRNAEPRPRPPERSLVRTMTATVEEVWAALEDLTDPEIPVISLRELGILREVRYAADGLEVVITPTYSGCPAMGQIEDDVRSTLENRPAFLRGSSPSWRRPGPPTG